MTLGKIELIEKAHVWQDPYTGQFSVSTHRGMFRCSKTIAMQYEGKYVDLYGHVIKY